MAVNVLNTLIKRTNTQNYFMLLKFHYIFCGIMILVVDYVKLDFDKTIMVYGISQKIKALLHIIFISKFY